MPRIERLIESQAREMSLSDGEAAALTATGRRLASNRTWFGGQPPEERTVIRCTRATASGTWLVRVQDAVGVVSVGDLQIVVGPKIPTRHLLHLFSKALQVPRLDDQPATAGAAPALWELVARWFVRSMMTVLRRDLSRDYDAVEEVLQTVRGQVGCVTTARAYYAGRIEVHCAFDDFVADTPLNRLLKAAAREISRSPLLTPATRRDAFRVAARMEDVGDFRQQDMLASADRRTWYYRDAVALAKHILRCVGRTFLAGGEAAWTFLIRTPDLVEAGVRQTLVDGLTDLRISKSSAPIKGAMFGAHPDLVFGSGWAVGDVKYKLTDGSWYRPDLYEVVAFAAAFRCVDAVLVCFSSDNPELQTVGVGETNVTQTAWHCGVEPEHAAARLCDSLRKWVDTIGYRSHPRQVVGT